MNSISRDEIKMRIRRRLEEILLSSLPADFNDLTPLREDLGLDSVQELDLLVGLEREYRFSLTEDDINPDLVLNVENLARFVEGKIS